jgi:hypothetical protein
LFFDNCLKDNGVNAQDNGQFNYWDNGSTGNYWTDYSGLDKDSNGIGDVPYNITGSAGSQDKFPLMECPSQPSQLGGGISGYNLFFLLGTISVVAIVISIKLKKFNK